MFFANFGFQPRFRISLPSNSVNPWAEELARRLKEINQDLTLELVNVQDRQKSIANNLRALVPNFQVEDMVRLLRRNITTTSWCSKLGYTNLGSFRINLMAHRCNLPPHYRIHDVFHVSLLEVYHPSILPRWQPARPPPIELDPSNEYAVEEILGSKLLRQKLYYLVHWRKYTRYLRLLGNLNTIWRMQSRQFVISIFVIHTNLCCLIVNAKQGV